MLLCIILMLRGKRKCLLWSPSMYEEKWRHASAMGQLTAWNDSMPPLISDLSNAVPMSLFLQHLG